MNLKSFLETRTNKSNSENARAHVAPKPNADGTPAFVCFAPPVS